MSNIIGGERIRVIQVFQFDLDKFRMLKYIEQLNHKDSRLTDKDFFRIIMETYEKANGNPLDKIDFNLKTKSVTDDEVIEAGEMLKGVDI
jgi:hypothetical protein